MSWLFPNNYHHIVTLPLHSVSIIVFVFGTIHSSASRASGQGCSERYFAPPCRSNNLAKKHTKFFARHAASYACSALDMPCYPLPLRNSTRSGDLANELLRSRCCPTLRLYQSPDWFNLRGTAMKLRYVVIVFALWLTVDAITTIISSIILGLPVAVTVL